ncbi:thioredoxin TrxC [Motilimonas pumila]|uniref:Thioredoxin n=1 Tax=Motilimonas pumila TaxID=2303987 RepID=A0A418YKV7_9GAMM|nr:thioredoxin TrxC [Motilimonas pumila]RJG51603.1 thioredoxin TrxC [Motilimonas pumila]
METCIIRCSQCHTQNRIPVAKIASDPQCGKCKQAILSGPVNATGNNFEAFKQAGLPIVIDFWASWCGPCQQFAPTYSQVATELAGKAIFLKLDTEAEQQLAGQFQIRSIPTLMVLKAGKEQTRVAGALPANQFRQWLTQSGIA